MHTNIMPYPPAPNEEASHLFDKNIASDMHMFYCNDKSGIPYYRLGGKTPLNNTRLSVACEFCDIITPSS